jgi:hypothetical protein
LLGQIIDDPRVMYSYGYSWESDVYCLNNLAMAYSHLTHCGVISPEAKAVLEGKAIDFMRVFRWAIRADYYAFNAGSSILPRESPGRVIASSANDFPYPRTGEIRKLVRKANLATQSRELPQHLPAITDYTRFCVGHAVALFARYLVKGTARAFDKGLRLTADHLRDVSLLTLPTIFRDQTCPIASHHRAQAMAIPAI